jgi:two-component system nitrogen regulation sensor histidine kinase GlnL
VAAARRLVVRERCEAIVASGPPWQALVVGALVARLERLPLLLDFRDPWALCELDRVERSWMEQQKAQLLERELDRPELREYTQVIIKEADRLQMLMDRLLAPHRMVQRAPVNIHEVCERVRSLILAEFPSGIRVVRDYDVSLPEFQGDREQLIQAVLNITRNASQALLASPTPEGGARITLRTRAAWQTSIAGRTCRLALELQVVDNGPGIAAELRERIFLPLVSGREGGTGLGLTLAQSFVQNHRGMIECESQPGRTAFRVLFPL